MIVVDGSQGEGGGQILRSSLALAVCTQQSFRIENIRANRQNPGLLRQHLTAVKAAAEICEGEVAGAALGARELIFKPGTLKPRSYSFTIGSAGSCALVLQTVLPPLLMASGSSTVSITGGTHNKGAPSFDFMQRAFLPLIARMGATVELELRRYGFYPRGGGEIHASITPATKLSPIELHQRGNRLRAYAEAYIAGLPLHIAQRELEIIRRRLNWMPEQLLLRGLANDLGPGNAVTITVEHENVTDVITGFGERGIRAEIVAADAARQARGYLFSSASVGGHLADQLLLPMALAGGGSFTATTVTGHFRANAFVIELFTGKRVTTERTAVGYAIAIR